MTHIRIVCRRPAPSQPNVTVLPMAEDCQVFAVAEDGTASLISGIDAVAFVARIGEPVRATLRFIDVDVDVEAVTSDEETG